MKLLTVVGARPQFIKAAAVGYAIEAANGAGADIRSILVHTGQHYDFEMSRVFFEELGLQAPDRDLNVGSASHGAQTGRMLEAIESAIAEEQPDVVLVYGDTNSTLAGALAAAKLHVPVAHVEAGLRSYNRRMPEEINRVLTDHVSRWLFCPTDTAVANLKKEGVDRGVEAVGDVMYELVVRFGGDGQPPVEWRELGVERHGFVLATIHRAENTDEPARLRGILDSLVQIASELPVMLPLHPRTQKLLPAIKQRLPDRIRILSPLSYRQMVAAEGSAAMVITDSGGVQKEAYWLGTPCVTARDETEWLETREDDRNIVAGATVEQLVAAARRQLARGRLSKPPVEKRAAASTIVRTLREEGSHTGGDVMP
jgi:UDP-GlcNAc3NAcA epimerase